MFVAAFEFEDGGRLYRCCVEGGRSARMGAWWWFHVSGDAQRYAPFHPEPDDTKSSVRTRIVSYYNALLARRAMPPAPRHGPGRRPGQPVVLSNASGPVPDANATPVADEPAHSDTLGAVTDV